ncbi:MAG: hypothetical protein RLZZ139_2263 [Cyanobacteriota bacterium]|jgi:hypothetical protein
MFDVIEVSIDSGKVVSFMAENKTKRNAETVSDMAVCRRDVDDSFYVVAKTGKYKIGDTY